MPAGATPKDGPSAGVAMFMALTSLFTGRIIRSDTAMTGEISLRGLVLPVGGIKEKVVAAAAAGITRVMLPARNKRDYDDIPEEVRKQLEFVWLEKVDDAVAAGLQPAGEAARPNSVVPCAARRSAARASRRVESRVGRSVRHPRADLQRLAQDRRARQVGPPQMGQAPCRDGRARSRRVRPPP